MASRELFYRVHVGALVLCAVFLPWSTAFLSLAQMLLVANWIVAGVVTRTAPQRWSAALTKAPSLVFLSFFLLHVVGLLWTTELGWGSDLVRILLPVLSLGAVLAGSERLNAASFRTILVLGAWSAVASTVFGVVFSRASAEDYRGLSMFISHIRLVLLLCFAIVVLLWDLRRGPRWAMVGRLLAIGWSLYFINRLGSIQGFFILAVLAAVALWYWLNNMKPMLRWAVRGALVLAPLVLLVVLLREVRVRTALPDAAVLALTPHSAGGERYEQDLRNAQQENGTHVWTHIAWKELRRTWARRSAMRFNEKDGRGHTLESTALRYLASRGLTKDSVGVMALTDEDVRAIERGVPNWKEGERSMVQARFDEVLFELQNYRDKGTAGGHSMAMRLEFWRMGWSIAREHWDTGVGTGDTQLAFNEAYERQRTSLAPEWRHRAHNQYLTLWISFGVFGLLWSLLSWWWPAWALGAWRTPLFVAWALIFAISCLTDDTIETQAGATFFGFYYALLVFAAPRAVTAPAAAPAA